MNTTPLDVEDGMRAALLAVRDVAEILGATDTTIAFGDLELAWSREDGCHLLLPDCEPVDLTEWVDDPGFEPVEGVESVREQLVLLAGVGALCR